MKKCNFILGVDVSSEWLNFCLMNEKIEIIGEWRIDNTIDDILTFFSLIARLEPIKSLKEVWLVMEHTGIYVQHLTHCALLKDIKVSLVAATKISEHLGGKVKFEDKTDPIDARRIAEYGCRFEDKLVVWSPVSQDMVKIKRLHRQRERMLKVINVLEVPVNECKKFDPASISKLLEQNQKASLAALKKALKKIEQQLEQIIEEDENYKQLIKRMKSVPGVGKVIATAVLIATEGFNKFKPDQAKAFNRFIGGAPLPKQSGKKKRKNKIPKKGKKDLKALLTMGAVSLIGTNSDLGIYYERKMAEGKHHLSVINAMRNKIILRIFAVVRNQNIYQRNLNVSLDKP